MRWPWQPDTRDAEIAWLRERIVALETALSQANRIMSDLHKTAREQFHGTPLVNSGHVQSAPKRSPEEVEKERIAEEEIARRRKNRWLRDNGLTYDNSVPPL